VRFIDTLQVLLFLTLLIALTPLLGSYMANVFSGRKIFIHSFLGWLERLFYRLCSIHPKIEMTWQEYTKAWLAFNILGLAVLFFLLVLQEYLPLNPQGFKGIPLDLAFNTAVSFITNTNWQAYPGETTLSYFSQMFGLTIQNFLSASSGLTVLIAFSRGISRKASNTLGNFWVDLVRGIVYIFLPLSFLLAAVLVSQGVIQTFNAYEEITTLEGDKQIIPLGPVASQVAIKQLGTNGGGFFNANSSHPFENPTGISNFLETLAILLIPAALVYTYGILVLSKEHGWSLFLVMFFLWVAGAILAFASEHIRNPVLEIYPVLEGKETRIGTLKSIFWAVSTTASANGSVNVMHSSLTPLAGGITLFNIMLEELVFGGIGVGLCRMIMFTLLTVFLSGLMVGRTPEYFGKKIEKSEIKWLIVSILMPGALILLGSGFVCILPNIHSSLGNRGPHGLTEILYAFSSTAENNGSAFAGFNANTPFFNIIFGILMIIGRISIVIPSLAIAGLLAKRNITPASVGTLSTESYLFMVLLISVILIIGSLTFFPALSLGPIVEELLMREGRSY
jgi:K+-transporting ATPase ATPase A chain